MDLETAITTQEQLDAIVNEKVSENLKGRLAREAKKYEGYTSPEDLEALKTGYDRQIKDLNKALAAATDKVKNHDAEIAERDAKIKGYETDSVKTRIAHETGLGYEAVEFLRGDDEESIRKSAEALKALTGSSRQVPPGAAPEKGSGGGDETTAAYRKMLHNMKGE